MSPDTQTIIDELNNAVNASRREAMMEILEETFPSDGTDELDSSEVTIIGLALAGYAREAQRRGDNDVAQELARLAAKVGRLTNFSERGLAAPPF